MIHSQSITYPYKDVNHGAEKAVTRELKDIEEYRDHIYPMISIF